MSVFDFIRKTHCIMSQLPSSPFSTVQLPSSPFSTVIIAQVSSHRQAVQRYTENMAEPIH